MINELGWLQIQTPNKRQLSEVYIVRVVDIDWGFGFPSIPPPCLSAEPTPREPALHLQEAREMAHKRLILTVDSCIRRVGCGSTVYGGHPVNPL